jgi:serine/threonine-protein kinase
VVATKLLDVAVTGRQRIDRYELVGEIASGGMATVYLARLTGVGGFQRFVAIKRLHPHLASEQEFVQMFLDEARLAAGIHHPNVVPILEVGASPLGYYLVMEYIEGDTLARLLARAATAGKKMPISIGLRIVLDMLQGLHAAHELRDDINEPTNLVHRDVSPQNVLVGGDGVARITDFGVARAASRLSETRVGQLKGKIAYMAPEQAMGAEELDRRADVFSAGVVIWEVLSAKRLFKADNDAATLTRLISDPIPALSDVAPQIGPNLSAVVAKSLERDPDRRYASCSQLAEALEEAGATDGEVGTNRDLAQYVSSVMGQEIAQQRDAVRAWLARSEPSHLHGRAAGPQSGTGQWAIGTTSPVPLGAGSEIQSGVTTNPGSATTLPTSVTVVTRSSPVPLVIALGAVAALLIVILILLLDRWRPEAPLLPPPDLPDVVELDPTATPGPSDPAAQPTGKAPEGEEVEVMTPEALPVSPRPAGGGRKPTGAKPKKSAPDDVKLINPYRQ